MNRAAFVLGGLVYVRGSSQHPRGASMSEMMKIGAVAPGAVMPLVYPLGIGVAAILFPVPAITIAAWFILAGVWKRRETRAETRELMTDDR
ncbi:MAG: hypothetical protein ABIR59_04410 [Gemmatimonadales bacterium]